MSDPVFLIDISAYLHRAMHVVYGDRAATVEPTDTAFVDHACVMLANTMVKLDVKRMGVICDSTEPSVRCDMYPAYKAERKPHTPVFAAQMPRFFDALRDLSVSVFDEPTYEADDLIATMVGEEPGTDYTVVSHDKDLLALVRVNESRSITVYNPMADKWYASPESVVEKFGVTPEQFYDYQGLVGDASDGIPGVAQVGPKTATKLIARFGNLEGIYADTEVLRSETTKAQFERLIAGKDSAFLSRRLAQPVLCDGLSLMGHGDLAVPHSDTVRGATLFAKRAG